MKTRENGLRMSSLKTASWAAAVLLLLATAAPGSGQGLPKPGPKDKCPVCGMFVAKYPGWTASVRFASGEQAFFDGVKDMLKFTFNMGRYAPGKTPADVAAVQVTDYYALEPIDGRTAFYVVGSDVFGPMGKELIPFAQRAQAEERDEVLRTFVVSLTAFLAGVLVAYLHVFVSSAALFEPVLKGWAVLYPRYDLVPHIDPYQLLALFFLTVVPYTVATVVPSWNAATVDPDLIMRQ
jgi:nitrous oxide reductase accessory protein NosL